MLDDECIERLVRQGTFVTPSLYFPYLTEHKRQTGKDAMPGTDGWRAAWSIIQDVPRRTRQASSW